MTQNSVDEAVDKAHHIDAETRKVLSAVKKKNAQAIKWFIVSWTILLVIGVFGIYKQNQIATANKSHIDCIVKLFTTPLAPGAKSRVIINPETNCDIKETK